MAGKTENMKSTWKILMKDADLEEPTSFLDHVYLGCTQRECKISNDIVINYRDMFEARISAGAKEKLPTRASGKLDAENHVFLVFLHGRSRNEMCGKTLRTCKKTTQQLYKSRNTMHGYDHHFKEEEMKSVGELSKVCSQIF